MFRNTNTIHYSVISIPGGWAIEKVYRNDTDRNEIVSPALRSRAAADDWYWRNVR